MAEKDTARVEAFSDGVFGVAITLLIVDFKVPRPPPDVPAGKWWLLASLAQLWPSFVVFVLSFGTVLILWVNHHGLFKHAHRANNRLLFANGFLLLLVTFVPFPTAVLAEYLDKPAANVAAAFYCATYVFVSLGYNLLLAAVVPNRAPAHVGSPPHEAALSRVRRSYRIGARGVRRRGGRRRLQCVRGTRDLPVALGSLGSAELFPRPQGYDGLIGQALR